MTTTTIQNEATLDRIGQMSSELREIKEVLTRLTADVNRLKPFSTEVSKDAQAIALMLTMSNPTKGKIAKAMEYKNTSALRHFKKFNAAWDKFQALQTVTGGNGRSIIGPDGADRHSASDCH